MSIGSDLLSSVTGKTDKACLVVHDVRENGQAMDKEINQLQSLGVMTEQQQSDFDILKRTRDAMSGQAEYAQQVAQMGGTDKTFFVQFNPSSLQLHSSSTPQMHRNVVGTNEDQNNSTDVVTAPRVELTVTLIFDKMNIYDAFMFDKFNSGASVTTVTNAVTMLSGKTFTVQPYVEGLISALRNPYTQSMTFQWADFSFTGRLRQLQANYTMFSVSGRPIRAQVQLRLQQDLRSSEMTKWGNEFDMLLSQKNSLVNAGQKVSNLFNLSL